MKSMSVYLLLLQTAGELTQQEQRVLYVQLDTL